MNGVSLVPIYDTQANIVNQIEIKDNLKYINGRVCKGDEYYYKGAGIPYIRHYVDSLDNINSEEYDIKGPTGIFYSPFEVSKKNWQNKNGIFKAKYQPFFPEFIGACSKKEGLIVLNSEIFAKSCTEVIDAVTYDKENQYSYYIVNYKGGRSSYIKDNGNPKKLRDLLNFMLQNNWNFLWDKGAINDVNKDGLVSDVADLFISDKLEHQFGTVYSVFYSLFKMNQKKYFEFLGENNLEHENLTSFVFNSVKILNQNGIKTDVFFVKKNKIKNYKHIVLNYLLTGKNCAYCACDMFTKEGELVKEHYIKTISKQMKHM